MTQPYTLTLINSVTEISEDDWDRLANPACFSGANRVNTRPENPFLCHAFLQTLEQSGCLTPKSGWHSKHLVLKDEEGTLLGILPNYIKDHSRGEYVFDQAWADAYSRAGGQYYPKLQCAVPFTPVTGSRFFVKQDGHEAEYRRALLQGAINIVEQNNLSSFHITFSTKAEWEEIGAEDTILQRTDQHPHFENNNYQSFDDFLATLASRKRKGVKKERKQALSNGISVEWISGDAITESHLDAMYGFYVETHSRKWGDPYLNREFFSLLAKRMPEQILLILAKREDRYIAGAFNIIGSDMLFGRYWGCSEHHSCLHFEICYYQAIDYAIANNLSGVNAGAGGGHKLARGYLPLESYSLHYIANPQFRKILQHHLEQEREFIDMDIKELTQRSPFKKDAS